MASKYAKRLDKSREYGSNHPPENGVFFWQDKVPFDHEGYVVDAVAEEVLGHLAPEVFARKLPLAKKPTGKPPAPAAKPPRPLEGSGDEGDEGDGDGGDDGLNLELWLKGEAEYPFPEVQKAVKARFAVWKTARRDLILFLVEDQKLVEPEALSEDNRGLIGG